MRAKNGQTKDGQAKDGQERLAEIRRLFAELGEVYGRVAALTEEPVMPPGQIKEERRKASAIMRRIRDIREI